MNTRRVSLALTAATLLAALALLPSIAAADHGTDSARGNVNALFGAYALDFSARSTGAGADASGRASLTLTNTDPNQKYSGEVTCLEVIGGTATTPATAVISVRLTDVPAGSTAQSMIIAATDSGKFSGGPDMAGFTLSAAPSLPDGACNPAFLPFQQPIADGEVVIHNTLP